MAVTHTIRTTNEPAIEFVVSHDEYEYLLELGLIYDGTPPVEPVDSFDAKMADRIGNPVTLTRGALSALGIGGGLSTEQVQDTVAAMVVAGANVTKTYDDTAGTLTIASTGSGGGSTAAQTADYVISISGSTVTATPRTGTGLTAYSGTDASTVLQNTITALTPAGARGTGGGHIHITRGLYFLNAELTITGWEGIAGTGGIPDSQLVISGAGSSTVLSQNTAGQNALVVKNLACFSLTDLRIATGASAKSCLLGDNNGAISEMSCWRSYINNVIFSSQSTGYPAVYLKNFFDLVVPSASIGSSANHGLVIENDSATTGYGNSHFGFLRTTAATGTPYAGLVLRSTNTAGNSGLLTFDNYECVIGYYGIWARGANFNHFNFVDLEANEVCLFLDSVDSGITTRHITVSAGYMLPRDGGTAIKNTSNSGGHRITTFIESAGTRIPLVDTQQFLPPNIYDLNLSDEGSTARIAITSPDRHALRTVSTGGTVSARGGGLPGSVTVVHGATAATARPQVAMPVVWYGSVTPTNLADGDIYVPSAAS